jgi:hypothetical protein
MKYKGDEIRSEITKITKNIENIGKKWIQYTILAIVVALYMKFSR